MRKMQGTPLPMGAAVMDRQVNFAVAVPEKQACSLLLYEAGQKGPSAEIPMEESIGEIHFLSFDLSEFPYSGYNFRIGGEVTLDPYVKRIGGNTAWNEKKDLPAHEIYGRLDTERYDWEGDRLPGIPAHRVVSYALHVRGFTNDRGAGVRKKGTFEGVAEKIPYLREMGFNQIQCMPVYEFEETLNVRDTGKDGAQKRAAAPGAGRSAGASGDAGDARRLCNFWGYGPAHCFAVKNAYSAIGDGAKSLKNMVKAFHRAGMEVVLEMPFYSGMPKLRMLECLQYYRMEYHIDGFIVNPEVAPMELFGQDPLLADTKILHHNTDFQNVMRRFLKGDEGMVPDVMYWLKHSSGKDHIFNYIAARSGFTLEDLVSYNEKHNEGNGERNRDGTSDNFSWNCGAEGLTRKKTVRTLRERQARNALFLVLLAQGTPCLLSGDEFGNSQEGNNNAYCQDNPVGWLNWSRRKKYAKRTELVKRLLEIRKVYPVFMPEREMTGVDRSGCGVPDVSYHGKDAWRVQSEPSSRQLGVYYSGTASQCEDVFVCYNMHWAERDFALPALAKGKKWHHLISTDSDEESREALENQKRIALPPRTVAVLVGKAVEEEVGKPADGPSKVQGIKE